MCLGLLEGEPSAQSDVLNALDWVFIKVISIFWCIEFCLPQSLPLKTTPQHEALLLGCYSVGDEQSRFPPNMMLRIKVHQTRESCFLKSEGPLGAFLCKFQVFSCVFTEQRIEFDHHKAQIGEMLQWGMSFCRGFPSVHMIMELRYSDHQLLGLLSRQGPPPSIVQFGQEASSRKSPGYFKLLPLRVTETTCFCEPSMPQNFSVLFPRSVHQCNPVSEVLDFMAWFVLWHALLIMKIMNLSL